MKDVVVKRSPEHTLLPQSDISIRKPSLPLQKELESKDFTDAVEGKTRMEGRKVIIRSSYFQHKQVIKNDQENEPEKLLVEVDGAIDISENVNLGFTSEDSCPQGTTVKRKTLLNDSVQKVGSLTCMCLPFLSREGKNFYCVCVLTVSNCRKM